MLLLELVTPEFTPNISGVCVALCLVFSVIFCRSFLVLCPFHFAIVSFVLRFAGSGYRLVVLKLFYHVFSAGHIHGVFQIT